MICDLTLKITPQMAQAAQEKERQALAGHLGTHFDAMGQEFPLEYSERQGIVLDVSSVKNREIDCCDIDLNMITKDMFVVFYSGYIERVPYASEGYFTEHPQLSRALIEALVGCGISMIGVDFAGVRRGSEHLPQDEYCAEKGVFIVENLCNLRALLGGRKCALFAASVYPMNYAQMTGLPCRVLARV